MECEHGVHAGGSTLPTGGWNGPVGRCSCCLSHFGYLEHGSYGADGSGSSKVWTPRDRCGSCGGHYVESSWGPRGEFRSHSSGEVK